MTCTASLRGANACTSIAYPPNQEPGDIAIFFTNRGPLCAVWLDTGHIWSIRRGLRDFLHKPRPVTYHLPEYRTHSCYRLSALGAASPVDIQELQASCLKPMLHDVGDAPHHFVAEVVVHLTLVAETFAVQGNCARHFDSTRIEMPAVGCDGPRPAQDVALSQGLDDAEPRPSQVSPAPPCPGE